ncbi:MAG: hypothetical protein M1378_12645 [Bacteroidetes bacterium]|nr:hypothetical protein [Bacteroidota bacterium]
MLAFMSTAQDSVTAAIPSFTSRFNFMLPLIIVLLILMFFLLIKSYTMEHPAPEGKTGPSASTPRKQTK